MQLLNTPIKLADDPKPLLLERFMKFVEKTESCWSWTGSCNHRGYGQFRVDERMERSHRVSYRLHVGDYGNLQVLHKCDNKRCVNPDHLFLGTNADNVADRVSKGRSADKKGECNGRAKVNVSQVEEIRSLRNDGVSVKALSKRFDLCKSAIYNILSKHSWSHAQ